MRPKTHRYFWGILFGLISFLMLNGSVVGQNDDALMNYQDILHKSTCSTKEISLARNLQKKWFCTDKRMANIESMEDVQNKSAEFADYLDYVNAFNSYSKDFFSESLKIINNKIKDNNSTLLGRFHFLRARVLYSSSSYNEAINEFHLADQIFTKNGDAIGEIYTDIFLMSIYGNIGNLDLAEISYLDIISQCQKNKYEKGLIYAYMAYSTYIGNRDLNYAHEILKKGWGLIHQKDTSLKISYSVKYMKFLLTYHHDDEFVKIYQITKPLYKGECNIGRHSIVNTLYAFWLSAQNKTDSAKVYNTLALAERKKYGNNLFIGFSYLNIFSNYLTEKKYQIAKMYLDSAKPFLVNGADLSNTRTYQQYLLKYYKATKQQDSLITTYQKLMEVDTSYYHNQQETYTEKINAQYNLQAQLEEEKYQTNIKHQKAKFWYTLIISILLGVLLLGILILFAKKSRSFKILKLRSYSKNKKLKDYEYELSQLKRVFQNDIAGLFFVDENTNIRYVNNKGKALLSSVNETVLTQSILDFIGDEFQKDFANCIQDVMKTGAGKEIQSNIAKEPNSWVNFSISPLFNGDKIESVLILGVDITERVRALETEKKQKTILQSLFNSVTESILLLDKDGKIRYINQTGANRIGKTENELIGSKYIDVLPPALRQDRANQIQESINKKEPIVYNENIGSFNNLVSIYPSFNEKGQLEHISEFTHDITENKLAHEQINSLRQKVLRSQMNPHFIFNSLNAIQSYVLKNDSELAVKYLNSFAKLIRMILDSSRFDYISLKKEINILEYYLQLQQLRFGDRFSWSMDVDKKIDLDSILIPVMLAQPFIENAIEHGLQHLTTKGQVKISFVRASDSIIFKVSDNGIGRDASKKLQKDNKNTTQSLSTQLFKERLFTLNKYSGRKITYDIIDVKDNDDNARGTLVIINLPIMYRTNIV